jgi:hypothetical protein
MSLETQTRPNLLDAVSIYTSSVTGLKIFEDDAMRASDNLLTTWKEPNNPLFDPRNYDLANRGKLPENILVAVPFTLALGGLTSRRSDLIEPELIANVADVINDNVKTFRMMDKKIESRLTTIRAAQAGLAIYETFGSLSFIGKNNDARKAIKKSNSFSRRELREIL